MTFNNNQTNPQTTGREWLLALPRLVWLAVKLGFDKDVPWETKSTLGLALAYIVSPIDGIPDFIPVVGQLEDMLVGVVVIDGIVNHIDRRIVMRHWTGKPETLDAIGRFTSRVTSVLPAFIRDRVMKRAFPKGWNRSTATGAPPPPGGYRKIVDAG